MPFSLMHAVWLDFWLVLLWNFTMINNGVTSRETATYGYILDNNKALHNVQWTPSSLHRFCRFSLWCSLYEWSPFVFRHIFSELESGHLATYEQGKEGEFWKAVSMTLKTIMLLGDGKNRVRVKPECLLLSILIGKRDENICTMMLWPELIESGGAPRELL